MFLIFYLKTFSDNNTIYTEVISFLNYIFRFWIILTILNNNQLSNQNQLKFRFYFFNLFIQFFH